MSQQDSNVDARTCGGDVAAYALGALDAGEVQAFEAHLETCAICRDELFAFQEVVAELPVSVLACEAPKRLRRRVMAAVAAEPKPGWRESPRRSWIPQLSGSRPRLGMAVAAVAAVVAIAAGALTLGGGNPVHTRVITARVTGSTGSAQVRLTGDRAELVVRNLSPPPLGQIYEVWLRRRGHAPAPTSPLFSVNSHGAGDVEVSGSLRGVNQIMVTPEPAGGSPAPTHPAVIRAALT